MLAGLVIIILAVMLLVTQIIRTRDRNEIKNNHATIETYNRLLGESNNEIQKLSSKNRELHETINGLRKIIADVESSLRGILTNK